ncbi:acyl-CoA reductase [Ramlibacter tataouinensis]|uniref:Acyl-CoA reductase n=1 Tax=Ramlibacter tataouinensis (strain ATCC BAA-407 / DSM 14655 / LMG 21543 / TTB310) TaxID=365046 RepID=F5Y0G7_RAMTT|nr:acyl-CoA reductase [Ramlibacter tataouinensis]AEG93373.1 acyl-CoA reductase-like protein [Ramlibacter tataouinensis TTB310]
MNGARLRAGYLPPGAADAVQWQLLPFEAHGRRLEVEVPLLTEAQMRALARQVRQAARERLRPLPVTQIVEVLDRVVARLLDAADPVRRQLDDLLPVVTGDDPELLRLGLSSYLQTFRAPQLHRFVAQDFANPKVLDGFQPAVKGGAIRAFGPSLLAHHWAGNVPGLPLWSLACGLLVKAGNIGKLPSAEPVFASLFAQLLAEVAPALADCLAIVWWKGGDGGAGTVLAQEADTVLAYGGNDTLVQLRNQLPASTRFLGYGHKLGLALVGREALDSQRGPAAARRAARDLVRHEQQGCYSPHRLYVERGGAIKPRAFARYLSGELSQLQRRHPRRRLTLEESASVAAWRQSAEWQLLGPAGELLGDDASQWSVAFSDEMRPVAPTAGHRCVLVCAVDALEDVAPLLEPQSPFLQTVGLATTPERLYRLAELLGGVGVTRIAPLGAMTRPEAGWHHDGRFNLADLVHVVEIEQAAEQAADRLAPYAQEGGE